MDYVRKENKYINSFKNVDEMELVDEKELAMYSFLSNNNPRK